MPDSSHRPPPSPTRHPSREEEGGLRVESSLVGTHPSREPLRKRAYLSRLDSDPNPRHAHGEAGGGIRNWEPPGPFFGHGPKGYRRPDERIHEDVCDYLAEHPWIDPSDVEVTVAGGEVTLEGTVADRRTKRGVEDVAGAVSGVRDVHNRLRIGAR